MQSPGSFFDDVAFVSVAGAIVAVVAVVAVMSVRSGPCAPNAAIDHAFGTDAVADQRPRVPPIALAQHVVEAK